MKRTLVLVSAALLALQLFGAQGARGHSPTMYVGLWFSSPVNFYWSGNPNWWHTIPDIAARMVEGVNTWNLAPATLHMGTPGDWAGLSEDCDLNSPGQNGLFWTNLGGAGGDLGLTDICVYPGTNQIRTVNVAIDGTEPNWHTGSGNPPADRWDLRSITTHEFGHATGFHGHWPDWGFPGLCPQSSTTQTMCTNISWYLGHTYFRTLGSHDSHTFDNRY